MTIRTGIGYDIHRLVPGRRLVLAGVEIKHPFGLDGHSDADVVLHAVCDALLGAAALGDIGELYPDTDAAFRGADSKVLLAGVIRRVREAGYRVGNVDVTIIAEQPRLSPYKPAMRRILAELLDVHESAVGMKASTNEGLGAIGRGLAIACFASVLLIY